MDPITFIGGFISAHPYTTLVLIAMYWLLSNVVAALPSPDQSSGKGYKFTFTLAHSLAGSLPRMFPKLRLQGDPSRSDQTYFGSPDSKSKDTPTP